MSMKWEEVEGKTGVRRQVDRPEYDEAVREHSPVLGSEEKKGPKKFEPVQMQPVISYGLFEGEFAAKGTDLIFHFWPYKYREDLAAGRRTRKFEDRFEPHLKTAMTSVFGQNRVEVLEDPEMGSYFVRAFGFGDHDFWKNLAIDACKSLHSRLGGSEG